MGAAAEVRRRLLEARSEGAGILLIYWRVPAEVLEDADTFVIWAKKAIQAAQDKKRGSKPPKN